MPDPVQLDIRDGIAWITLDDGKVNALCEDRLRELGRAFAEAERAGAVAVLRGRPGIFSAGFDLGTFARGADAGIAMVRAGAELIVQLLSLPRPILSVCTGHAYPMGAFLMLASDVRLATAGDFRIGMNEVAIGLTVPRFAVALARHRLTRHGFAAISSAALFGPEQAVAMGYADRVLAPDALEDAACEEAERLRGLDDSAYAATKQRLHGDAAAEISAAIEQEWREVA